MLNDHEQTRSRQINSRLPLNDIGIGRTGRAGSPHIRHRQRRALVKIGAVMSVLFGPFMLLTGSLSGALVLLALTCVLWGVWRGSDYEPTADHHDGGPSRAWSLR